MIFWILDCGLLPAEIFLHRLIVKIVPALPIGFHLIFRHAAVDECQLCSRLHFLEQDLNS